MVGQQSQKAAYLSFPAAVIQTKLLERWNFVFSANVWTFQGESSDEHIENEPKNAMDKQRLGNHWKEKDKGDQPST